MALTNKQRIANVLNTWDEAGHHQPIRWRCAGYIEAMLQNDGVLVLGEDLPYKTTKVKGFFFGSYEVKETYPELMYRLATEHLRGEAT